MNNWKNPGKSQNAEFSFHKGEILQDLKDGTFQSRRLSDRCPGEALGQLLLQPRQLWVCAMSSELQEGFFFKSIFEQNNSVPCSVLIQCQPCHSCREWKLSVLSAGSGGRESRIFNVSQLHFSQTPNLQWHRKELLFISLSHFHNRACC